MNIEALWAVEFIGANNERVARSGGVVVIETGRIFGGDSWQWYTGHVLKEVRSGKLSCTLHTGVHFTVGGESIFGGPPQSHDFIGSIEVADEKTLMASLEVRGNPQMKIVARLTWIAPLP